jgi:alpha-galactosidase
MGGTWGRLLIGLLAAGVAAASNSSATDLRGDWIFQPSPDFPQFTTLTIAGSEGRLHGTIRSQWYGDLPLLDLRDDAGRLVFKLDNGNPRLEKHDLTLAPETDGLRLTGQFWYAKLNVTARRGTAREVAGRAFPTYPLPALRDLPDNGLARTPPMGWNSWNEFATNIDDKTVREIAAALVATGLKDAGYVYINIDDGWQGIRDSHGVLQPNAKFPDMARLAEYLHAQGLKLGIYSSPGPKSCAGYTGSYGHVAQDATTWAAWGVDYLKYDLCSGEAFYRTYEEVRATYQQMGEALQATGRPIVFSLCEYGRFDVGTWGRKAGGNLWRTTGDISDNYTAMASIGFDKTASSRNAGPGGWNDPDMLEIGNGGMTPDEYRSHMSLWALLAAPLLLGNDVRNMSAQTRAIVANREVIAVDQDPLGRQAERALRRDSTEVWVKPLADGSSAVGLFNRATTPANISIDWKELGLGIEPRLRDLWQGVELEHPGNSFSIAPHGVVLLRAWPLSPNRTGRAGRGAASSPP